MPIAADFLASNIATKGWAAVNNIYFNNAVICNVFSSKGYVTLSKTANMIFWVDCSDTTDSWLIENGIVYMDNGIVGHQQHLLSRQLDLLEHIDWAMYAFSTYSYDDRADFPLPAIPTQAQIEAYIHMNPDGIGNYPNGYFTDTSDTPLPHVVFHGGAYGNSITKHSCIPLYDVESGCHSALNIEYAKAFYANHEKFKTAVQTYFGLTDCI